jgi:hypothetical protein
VQKSHFWDFQTQIGRKKNFRVEILRFSDEIAFFELGPTFLSKNKKIDFCDLTGKRQQKMADFGRFWGSKFSDLDNCALKSAQNWSKCS